MSKQVPDDVIWVRLNGETVYAMDEVFIPIYDVTGVVEQINPRDGYFQIKTQHGETLRVSVSEMHGFWVIGTVRKRYAASKRAEEDQ